jgi:hypothetical protein
MSGSGGAYPDLVTTVEAPWQCSALLFAGFSVGDAYRRL